MMLGMGMCFYLSRKSLLWKLKKEVSLHCEQNSWKQPAWGDVERALRNTLWFV